LHESPAFINLKSEGKISKNPIIESFANWYNLKYVLLALFGCTMGQGVTWYTGQFYALFYLQTIFKLPLVDSNVIVVVAIALATPFFVVVGWLSDKFGRRWFIRAGLFLAVATYYPLYIAMNEFRYYNDPTAKPLVKNANYNPYVLCLLVWIQIMYVTLVYGPIAAMLVELFPTQIRYTSMSVPYHIGNGVFGGLVPVIGLSLIQATGNNYAGLWYPMGVIGVTLIINLAFMPETFKNDVHAGRPTEGKN